MKNFSLGRAVLELLTDDSKYVKGIDDAEKKAGKLGGTFGKISATGKVVAGVLGGTVVGALSDFAQAAADDEANALRLQTAIENSGESWGDWSDRVDAAIKKGQELAFSDDATRNAIAELTESTGSAEEAMRRLGPAMDLARAKSIPLESAAKLLGKVSDENTKALKRMGIVLGEGADATAVLGAVQQKFGGQAEAYGNTTKAWGEKARDAIGEFTEGIGASLGPTQGLIAMLPGLQSGMSLVGGALGGLSSLIKLTFIPSLIAMAVPFAPLLIAIGASALAVGLLALAWSNNWGDIQGKAKAVLDFLAGTFDGFKLLVLTVFRAIVLGVTGAINGVIGVINGFIEAYNGVAEKLGLPLIGKIELMTPNLSAVDAAIAQVARDREARIIASISVPVNSEGTTRGMFHGGTPFVPRTGTYVLERGEAIISADENRARAAGAVGAGHDHPIYLDGRLVGGLLGRRTVRGTALAGAPIG